MSGIKTALNISEQEYRSLPYLSYSKIAKYEREGFMGYLALDDDESSPSLTFGSAVDCLLTEGKIAFENNYVCGVESVTGKQSDILTELAQRHADDSIELKDIDPKEWENVFTMFSFNPKWKTETKIAKFDNDESRNFFDSVKKAKGKTVLPEDVYNDVLKCANALKYDKVIGILFNRSSQFEILYQVKMTAVFNGRVYKIMADIILIDHNNKKVFPIDLKTSSKHEGLFWQSFLHWRYDLQARLYWLVIKDNLVRSDMGDYELMDYTFIVINRQYVIPLSWTFEHTSSMATLITEDGQELRHPLDIGNELYSLIENRALLPHGVTNTKANKIENFVKMQEKMEKTK